MTCINWLYFSITLYLGFSMFFLIEAQSSTSFTSSSIVGNACSDPLVCYLNSLVINFPEICEPLDNGDLCIKDFTCSNLNIQRLPSLYEVPTSLWLSANDLGANCQGEFTYGRLLGTDFTAILSQTNITLTLFVEKQNNYPMKMNFSTCEVPSINIDLTFSGTILDTLVPIIERLIKKMVYSIVCVQLNHQLDTNSTSFFLEKNPLFANITNSLPSPLPVYDNTHYLNWSNSIVSKLHNSIQSLDGFSNLPSFVRCMINASDDEQKVLSTNQSPNKLFASHYMKQSPFPDMMNDLLVHKGIDIPLTDANLIYTLPPTLQIQVISLNIQGLDTIDDLEILQPIPDAPLTLRTEFQSETLSLEVTLLLTTNMSNTLYTEEVMLSFEVTNSSLIVDLSVVLNQYLFDSYYLDQLSSSACWLNTIVDISFPNIDLNMNISSLTLTEISDSAGLLEEDIVELINNGILLLIAPTGFQNFTTGLLEGILQGPLRNTLNTKISTWLIDSKASKPCLTHYPYNDQTEFIEFPTSQLITTLDYLINEYIGYEGINQFFSCLTNGLGSVTIVTKRLAIEISGLTSFYGLELFSTNPMKIYNLHSFLAAGLCSTTNNSSGCTPLEINIKPSSTVLHDSTGFVKSFFQAVGDFSLSLTFENLQIYLETFLQINRDSLRDLQSFQVGTTGCLASSFNNISVQTLSVNVSHADIIYAQGDKIQNITGLINHVLSFITRPETIMSKNEEISSSLAQASDTCANGGVNPDSIDDDPSIVSGDSSHDWKWEMSIIILMSLCSLFALLAAYNYWGRVSAKGHFNCWLVPIEGEVRPWWEAWGSQETLICHPKIPIWIRYIIPVMVLFNIGIFIWSNYSPDACSVLVDIYMGDKVISLGSIFDFGLGNTVSDMWSAKVYALAVLIAFFSGAWPYVKLLLMFVSWVTPPRFLKVSSRENILIVLDALGKWSLLDFYVMVLMLCAFYFELIVGENLSVHVTVLPKWGFYSFLLATMISLGLGHTILACHRLVVEPKVETLPEEYDPKLSLANAIYAIDMSHNPINIEDLEHHDPDDPEYTTNDTLESQERKSNNLHETLNIQLTILSQGIIFCLGIITLFFIIVGTFTQTVGFEFEGLTGYMLKSKSKVDYSYYSIGFDAPAHSGQPDDLGIRWMQASYMLFGIGMPLALIIVLLFLWFVPMTLSRQRQIHVLSEVLNAWAALDVFCIAIVATLLEVPQFADFIIGDSCDQINVVLAKYFDDQLDGNDVCFGVSAYLKTQSWTLLLAAGLVLLFSSITLLAAHHIVKYRLHHAREEFLLAIRQNSTTLSPETMLPSVSIDDPLTMKLTEEYGEGSHNQEKLLSGDVSSPLLSDTNPMMSTQPPSEQQPSSARNSAATSSSSSVTWSQAWSQRWKQMKYQGFVMMIHGLERSWLIRTYTTYTPMPTASISHSQQPRETKQVSNHTLNNPPSEEIYAIPSSPSFDKTMLHNGAS